MDESLERRTMEIREDKYNNEKKMRVIPQGRYGTRWETHVKLFSVAPVKI